jgi:hypothetical protein
VLSFIASKALPQQALSREPLPVLLGVVDKAPFGRIVTLKDCRVKGRSFGFPGIVREEYYVGRAYFGDHLTGPTDFSFREAWLRLSGLDAWAERFTGLRVDWAAPLREKSQSLSIHYQPPEPIVADLPGGRLSLGLGSSATHGLREGKIEEYTQLHLELQATLREEEIHRRIVHPLQNLFTFATDRPNALTQLSFTRAKAGEGEQGPPPEIRVIGPRVFSDAAVAAKALPPDMLFTLDDVQGRFGDVVSRWLELAESYRSAFDIFFGAQYAPQAYQDLRLQVIAHALHLYSEKRAGGLAVVLGSDRQAAEVTSGLTAEQGAWLRAVVSGNQLFRVEKALAALLAEQGTPFAPLVRGEVGRFREQVLATLRYLLNREAGEGAVSGIQLYWMTQRLMFLMKISLLKDLAFTEEQVLALLAKNQAYNHISRDVPV